MMTESCFAFSPTDIVKCENAILEFLQWRSLVPTCSEILKLLLCMSNPSQDFTDLVKRANDFIFLSLLEYEMAAYSYSSIALASLLCVLDELEY
jgi:Cyclin, C-terminal domain